MVVWSRSKIQKMTAVGFVSDCLYELPYSDRNPRANVDRATESAGGHGNNSSRGLRNVEVVTDLVAACEFDGIV